jgi:hypothetical protein
MKQMLSRIDPNSEYLRHQIISYTEFPPLVPPIMAKESNESRKKAGGFMVASDKNTDIMPPILRPDLDDQDTKRYEELCQKLGIDPAMKDKESYMQLMNYNQICYLELRPMAPHFTDNWKLKLLAKQQKRTS